MQRVGFITVGILLFINAIGVFVMSNMNIGLILTFVLGIIFILYGIFLEGIVRTIPKWIKAVFFTGVTVVSGFVCFLFVYGNVDNATYGEDAVIVLGCGVKGEEPTESLKNRLECVIDYHYKNPNALIVLSGGQGEQEDITEALAMEKYLLERGIQQDIIIKEEQSTNTYENFIYSKQLLDEYFQGSYTVAYITNDYHIFRAGNISCRVGYEDATHCSAGTPWYMVISSGVRECVGVMKFVVLG